jgi:hypothetical protein
VHPATQARKASLQSVRQFSGQGGIAVAWEFKAETDPRHPTKKAKTKKRESSFLIVSSFDIFADLFLREQIKPQV